MKIILYIILCFIIGIHCSFFCSNSIQGEWLEAENEKNILCLVGNHFFRISNLDTVATGIFKRQKNSCNKAYADSSVVSDFLIFEYNGSEYCYEVVSLSDTILVYRNIINGGLYRYYKKGSLKPLFGPDR